MADRQPIDCCKSIIGTSGQLDYSAWVYHIVVGFAAGLHDEFEELYPAARPKAVIFAPRLIYT